MLSQQKLRLLYKAHFDKIFAVRGHQLSRK